MKIKSLNTTFAKPLSSEEEQYYLDRMFNGDISAKDELIVRNLRLVAHISKKFNSNSNSHSNEDLISLGTVGLIKGINSFKADKKTKLSTYLSKCIQNEILMNLRITKKYKNDISMQEPLGADSEGHEICIEDKLEDKNENVEKEVELQIEIERMLSKMSETLTEKESYILKYRYGIGVKPLTQRELSEILGISRSYVSRIEKKSLEKLYIAIK